MEKWRSWVNGETDWLFFVVGPLDMLEVQKRPLKIHKHCAKNEISVKEFFSKCDQIRSFLWIWTHLLNDYLMETFILCAVKVVVM